MKGTQSGVQELIRSECRHVLDVPCICYLADLAVKDGMQVLPVNILLTSAIFITVVNVNRNIVTIGALITTEPQTILKLYFTR